VKRWALALGVVLVGVPARASADPPDSRANTSPSTQEHPPVIVPPRALGDVRAAYPKGAEGRATVVVELTVTAEGDAQDVHAASGDEPWATPALEAVRALRFDPATRDGHPIAAKIRMRVDFEPPVERPRRAPARSVRRSAPDAAEEPVRRPRPFAARTEGRTGRGGRDAQGPRENKPREGRGA
jgi:TonB family protein